MSSEAERSGSAKRRAAAAAIDELETADEAQDGSLLAKRPPMKLSGGVRSGVECEGGECELHPPFSRTWPLKPLHWTSCETVIRASCSSSSPMRRCT